MKIKLIGLSLAALAFTYACKETKKEEKKAETPVVKNDLPLKLQQIQDSTSAAWKFMMEADDQKIAFTKRLLDEISYTPKYDVIKHAKLMEKCLALKSKRFDTVTVSSHNIDRYDMATDSLLREVRGLVLSTPNVENYPLCSELMNDINALDNDVVMHRVKYDNWAMKYNNILENQHNALQALGKPYSELKPKTTFQLEN